MMNNRNHEKTVRLFNPVMNSHIPRRKDAAAEDLEFPVDPDFISLPPRLDLQVMLRRLEETMPWLSTRPVEQERRLEAKVDVEFVL
jgi:hypothetical protein